MIPNKRGSGLIKQYLGLGLKTPQSSTSVFVLCSVNIPSLHSRETVTNIDFKIHKKNQLIKIIHSPFIQCKIWMGPSHVLPNLTLLAKNLALAKS